MSIHDERLMSLLVELAANFIAREAGRETLITPTRAELSSDGKHVTIFVSVFPDAEVQHALTYLERNRDEFRQFMRKEARLSHLPFVSFAFDEGERARQHLDELSRDL